MAVSACSFTPVKPGTVNSYDEFTGLEKSIVGPFQVERNTEWSITRGTDIKGTDYAINVVKNGGSGNEWRFLRNNRMDLIVDGERQSLGDAHHDGDVRIAGAGGVYTVEILTYILNKETLQLISGGIDTLKGRIGSLEFSLNPEQIKALNQFADTEITPYLIN